LGRENEPVVSLEEIAKLIDAITQTEAWRNFWFDEKNGLSTSQTLAKFIQENPDIVLKVWNDSKEVRP